MIEKAGSSPIWRNVSARTPNISAKNRWPMGESGLSLIHMRASGPTSTRCPAYKGALMKLYAPSLSTCGLDSDFWSGVPEGAGSNHE